MKIITKSTCAMLLLGALCSGPSVKAQTVPSNYTTEYGQLTQALGSFITSLDNRSKSPARTCFAAELQSAASANGLSLLTPAAEKNMLMELNEYKRMGVGAIVIQLRFPMLCSDFWSAVNKDGPNDAAYRSMVSYYQYVIAQCHSLGIKVIAETGPVDVSLATLGPQAYQFASNLSQANYTKEMAQDVTATASCRPDVISFVAEPNTDNVRSNQSLYENPAQMQAFVQSMVGAVSAVNTQLHASIVTAAGAPAWMTRAQDYDTLLEVIPALTAIDLHQYFAGNSELITFTALADAAKKAGKQVISSECWLNKAGVGSPPASPTVVSPGPIVTMAVDAFSFWIPLDEQFMSAIVQWCQVEQPTYFTFFEPNLLFAYLNYAQVGSQSYTQIRTDEQQAAQAARSANQFSTTGTYYSKLIQAQ